jgi:filamentous hemagglutinin family protein
MTSAINLLSLSHPLLPTVLLLNLFTPLAKAQIVPDATLRNNSVTNFTNPQWNITGGETIGNTLFHSFSQFNLGTGQIANFQNAATLGNIIARITGGTVSLIDGTLQTNGNTNLFLINPKGLIFGPNAQLNIAGSFIASTAESIRLADGSSFSATHPQAPSLLAVNVPLGLQWGSNPGDILLRAQQLIPPSSPQPNRTLAFVGGNVILDGAQLQSPQSRIELGAVGSNSFVNLTAANNSLLLGYNSVSTFQDIQLARGATVDASGEGGGAIQFQGRRIAIADGSRVQSITQGTQPGGDILLRGSELIALTGADPAQFTAISSDTLGEGSGGNLTLETGQFLLQGTAFLSSSTLGAGAGGNLTLRAADRAVLVGIGSNGLEQFIGGAFLGQIPPTARIGGLFVSSAGEGRGGNLSIETGSLNLLNGALVIAPTFGPAAGGNIDVRATRSLESFGSALITAALANSQGAAGNIALNTQQLIVKESSLISSVTFGSGRAGEIAIAASDFAEISDTRPDALFPSGITNNSFGTGAGGNIRITTGRLFNRGGGIISANSGGAIGTGIIPFGGPGGDIEIEASESVEISGTVNFFRAGGETVLTSGPSTTTFTAFPAGDLTLRTRRLQIQEGAIVSSATLSSGKSGNLLVEASESVEVSGRSIINGLPSLLVTSSGRADFTQIVATGNGGNLTIYTGDLVVRDGATLDVRSFSTGDAGTLEVRANSIFLDRGGSLNASTVSGRGGNVFLEAPTILLRRGSKISTNAGDSTGGNIRIDTTNLVAVPWENSDISANSLNFRGGNITINATGSLIGLRFRPQNTPQSDITATGRDSSLGGTVILNTLLADPGSGLQELPETVSDPSDQVVVGCAAAVGNSFVITGRGGLPDDPMGILQGQTVWEDLHDWSSTEEGSSVASVPSGSPKLSQPMREAKSWTINAAGNVELVATSDREPRFPLSSSRCTR